MTSLEYETRATEARPSRARLGDILVEHGLVDESDIEAALVRQSATRERLGQILLAHDKIGAHGIAIGLAALFGMDVIDLSGFVPDPTAVACLPEHLARRLHAVPVRWDDNVLVIAVDDPSNLPAMDDVRAVVGTKVRFVVGRVDQLPNAIDRAWQMHHEEVVEDPSRSIAAVDDIASSAEEAPVIKFVNELLRRARTARASDIHLEETPHGGRIRFRVDGVLHDFQTVGPDVFGLARARLKLISGLDIAQQRIPQDGRMSVEVGKMKLDVRVATLPTIKGESVVMRLLDNTGGVLTTSDLGFLPDTKVQFEAACHKPWGTVLVTGPTGSGKTTTLYAAVSLINRPDQNLVTVEDPVEFKVDGIKQVQVSERSGMTFDRSLRGILRCDPDILLIGEVRDRDTARIAAEAALSGHLVLTTLHTKDSCSAPLRLIEMGLEPYLVSTALDCVVAQRLSRLLCRRCAEEYVPTAEELAAVGWLESGLDLPLSLKRSRGCPDCNGTGYKGRFAMHELLEVTPEIRKLILANASAEVLRTTAINAGMRPLRTDGLVKVAAGQTSLDELVRVAA